MIDESRLSEALHSYYSATTPGGLTPAGDRGSYRGINSTKPVMIKRTSISKYPFDPVPPREAQKDLIKLLNKNKKKIDEESIGNLVKNFYGVLNEFNTVSPEQGIKSFHPRSDTNSPNSLMKVISNRPISNREAAKEVDRRLNKQNKNSKSRSE